MNGVKPGNAQSYCWHQEMLTASNPVYMGATNYPAVQTVAIHARHAQALPNQQAAPVMGTEACSNRVSELRKALIDQIVWYFAVAGHQSGLPLFAGAFAQDCRRKCQRVVNPHSGAEEYTAITAEQLLDCPLMHVVTSREMGNMMPVMDWLLHKEKMADSTLLCGVTNGSLGELVFSWYIGGQPLFAIGVLVLSAPASLDVLVQEYLTGDGRRVPLRTSRSAAAAWLNEKLQCGVSCSGDPSNSVIRGLQGLAISAVGSVDFPQLQFWQAPAPGGQEVTEMVQSADGEGVATSSVPTPFMSPPVFPVVPYMVSMPAVPQAPVNQMPVVPQAPVNQMPVVPQAPVSQMPVLPQAPAIQMSVVIPGVGAEHPAVQWSDSSPGNDVEVERHGPSVEWGTPPEAGPGGMKNDFLLKKYQDAVLDLGFPLIRNHFFSRVSDSMAPTTPAFTSMAIDEKLVTQLQELLGIEAGDFVHHSFLYCPYLGTAQCFYVKRVAAFHNSRRRKLMRLIGDIIPQLCQTVIDAGELPFEKLNELRALIVVLVFKYLVYMTKTRDRLNPLMAVLADLIDADCNRLAAYEPGTGAGVLRLVPQAFLVVLNSAEILGRRLSSSTERRIVCSLGSILLQSKRHGCSDIMAAVVSLLPRLPLQLILPMSDLREVRALGEGVQDAFRYFHELLNVRAPSLLHRLSVARTILELSDSLDATPDGRERSCRQWLATIGGDSDSIAYAVNSAGKILGADEMAFLRAVREFAQSDHREREEVHQQLADAVEAQKPVDAEPEPWELQLADALGMFRQGRVAKALEIRDAALAGAGDDKLNQSRIWVECGTALLEPHREIIALSITLTSKADGYQRQLERISQEIPRSFIHRQSHDAVANAWLVDNNYTIPKERSLIVLADHVPTPVTIGLLLKALNTTVSMYKQAVELLRRCSAAELQDRADYILRTMEFDLGRLIENGAGLVAPSRTVANVMTLRHQILRQLGFLDDRHPSLTANFRDQGEHRAKQQFHWRSAYARASERIYREVEQLGCDQGSVAQWVEVMDAIGKLRCKQRA